MSPHLSNDNLIGLLYGIGEVEEHLAGCAACRERLNAMQAVRAETAGAPQISGRKLAVQRIQVLDRAQRPPSPWRWIPAPAAIALVAAALYLVRPSSIPQTAPTVAVSAEADAALFTDVYSMEQEVEPKAAAPIRGLFQETSFETPGTETSGEERR